MSNIIDITTQTVDVLKSFEGINKSIMFRQGKMINTRSIGQNIIAEYVCDEEFPQTFAVYELSQFLSGLSLFDTPSLKFDNDDFVTIRSQKGNRNAKYFFSDPSIVEESSPERRLRFPEEDVVMEFKITESDLASLHRASGVYDLDDIKMETSPDGIVITVFDSENETNNTYSITVPGQFSSDFCVFMKIASLHMMKGDYHVSITDESITKWKHNNLDLVYYISTEPDPNE